MYVCIYKISWAKSQNLTCNEESFVVVTFNICVIFHRSSLSKDFASERPPIYIELRLLLLLLPVLVVVYMRLIFVAFAYDSSTNNNTE